MKEKVKKKRDKNRGTSFFRKRQHRIIKKSLLATVKLKKYKWNNMLKL